MSQELQNPREKEEKGKEKRLKNLIEAILAQTGYTIDVEELPDEEKAQAVIGNLSALFEASISRPKTDLALAKYVLSRAISTRMRSLYNPLFNNLTKLLPALTEVVKYLEKTMPKEAGKAAPWGLKLQDYMINDDAGDTPFVRCWLLHLLAAVPELLPYNDALSIARDSQLRLGVRPAAILAREHKQLDWVRARKENWQNHSPWDKRAIIWAASILPNDERRSWLDPLKDDSDILTRSVARLAVS